MVADMRNTHAQAVSVCVTLTCSPAARGAHSRNEVCPSSTDPSESPSVSPTVSGLTKFTAVSVSFFLPTIGRDPPTHVPPRVLSARLVLTKRRLVATYTC